jgi:hypothetical protein
MVLLDKDKLLKWLEELYAGSRPRNPYDEWNSGKCSAIDVIMSEIESGTFDKESK